MRTPNLPNVNFSEIPGWKLITQEGAWETMDFIKKWELWISAVSEDWSIIIVTNRHVGEVYMKTSEWIKVLRPNWRDKTKNSVQSRWLLAAEAVVTIDGVPYIFKTWRHTDRVKPEDFFQFGQQVGENEEVKRSLDKLDV